MRRKSVEWIDGEKRGFDIVFKQIYKYLAIWKSDKRIPRESDWFSNHFTKSIAFCSSIRILLALNTVHSLHSPQYNHIIHRVYSCSSFKICALVIGFLYRDTMRMSSIFRLIKNHNVKYHRANEYKYKLRYMQLGKSANKNKQQRVVEEWGKIGTW